MATTNFLVLLNGTPVAHAQKNPTGVLLTPGSLTGNKLAELGLAMENRDLPEGFTLKEVRVSEQILERGKQGKTI
jgi:hypothetical protein